MELLNDFLNLIFPVHCAACGEILMKNERIICSECIYHLPRTDYHLDQDNPVARIFWGRIRIEQATAYYFFNKGSRFRRLIHELKYLGRQDIGVELGRAFGYDLMKSGFRDIDLIVPVPLHVKRKRERGYNQAELLARSLARGMAIPWGRGLARVRSTLPQIGLTDSQRRENVRKAFQCTNPQQISKRRILLVDDVMTTGATVASASDALLAGGALRISVLTVARAEKR